VVYKSVVYINQKHDYRQNKNSNIGNYVQIILL